MKNKQQKMIIEWEDKPYTNAQGWLVIDTLINGVCGGGIFIQENTSLKEVCDVARDMTYKNLLNPIPFGGAKAGIKYAPSNPDILEVLTRFLLFNKKVLTNVWCTSADMNTTHAMILTIVKKNLGLSSPFYSLGEMYAKKLGIPNQAERMEELLNAPVNDYFNLVGSATGYVLAAIISYLAKGEPIKLLIQGFGNIGGSLAFYAQKYFNIKVIGISDISGCLVDEKGLDIPALIKKRKLTQQADLSNIIDNNVLTKAKWRKNDFENAQKFLSYFLKHSQADCVSLCAARYSVNKKIINDMANYCLADSLKKFLLCGANTVLANEELVTVLFQNKIVYLPTWFTNSGNSLLFGYLLSRVIDEEPMSILKHLSDYVINLLSNAEQQYHSDPYTALYERQHALLKDYLS